MNHDITLTKEYGIKKKQEYVNIWNKTIPQTITSQQMRGMFYEKIEELRKEALLFESNYDMFRNTILRLPDGSKIEIRRKVKKSKLPLVLSAIGLSSLIATALIGLPEPYGIILSIAICGPLYVSLYGLKKNG